MLFFAPRGRLAAVLAIGALCAWASPAAADEGEVRAGIVAGGALWWAPPSRGDSLAFGGGWTAGATGSYGVSDEWSIGLEGYYNGIIGDLVHDGVRIGGVDGVLYENLDYFAIGAFGRWTAVGRNLVVFLAGGVGVYSSNHTKVDLYSPDEASILRPLSDKRITNAYVSAGPGLEYRFLDYFFLSVEVRADVVFHDQISAHIHLPLQMGYYF